MLKSVYKKKTIKNKIFFSYVLLLIVPLSLITALNYYKSADTIENQAVEQFVTVSQLANNQFDQYFMDIENLSVNIYSDRRVQERLSDPYLSAEQWTVQYLQREMEMVRFLEGIYKLKPGISSVIVYGLNGQHYYYDPKRLWNHAYDATQTDWYQKALDANGQWVLSGKREEKELFNKYYLKPEEVVSFTRVINDFQTFQPIGVLVINVKIKILEELSGVDTAPHQLVILDDQGDPVVASDAWEGRLQGEDLFKVSTDSPYTQWTSVYLTSKSKLIQESKQLRNFTIAATVILSLIALLFANFISRGIVKPLQLLKGKMKRLEKGEFNQVIPVHRPDEVGELTLRFNHMVSQIKVLVEEIRRKERQKRETELNALQARINPHFMYNTLNGMRWVAMMDGNKKIADWLTSFVYLLKFSAKNQDSLITVENELRVLDHYVSLMKMRHDPFTFQLTVDDRMQNHLVVPFLLQPIVENAIFHGIVPLKEAGRIEVALFMEQGRNVAVVRDNGVGMDEKDKAAILSEETEPKNQERYSKIGLKNVYDRIRLQFGPTADLQVTSQRDGGTEVRVCWPIIFKKGAQPND